MAMQRYHISALTSCAARHVALSWPLLREGGCEREVEHDVGGQEGQEREHGVAGQLGEAGLHGVAPGFGPRPGEPWSLLDARTMPANRTYACDLRHSEIMVRIRETGMNQVGGARV